MHSPEEMTVHDAGFVIEISWGFFFFKKGRADKDVLIFEVNISSMGTHSNLH